MIIDTLREFSDQPITITVNDETYEIIIFYFNFFDLINFILMHSVGSIPHGAEVDRPLVYADYYFLEALKRKSDIESGKGLKLTDF